MSIYSIMYNGYRLYNPSTIHTSIARNIDMPHFSHHSSFFLQYRVLSAFIELYTQSHLCLFPFFASTGAA